MEELIIELLEKVLNIKQSTYNLNKDSLLLGSIPELDSQMFVKVLTAIEQQFCIRFEDDEIDANNFKTIGHLSQFVQFKISEKI